jgi:signal transduction histidine kinase
MPEDFPLYFYTLVALFLLLGVFILVLAVFYSKKQVRNRVERDLMKNQFQQTLLQSQLEIQTQTMQHISAELHDNIGQIASLIKINLITLNLDEEDKAKRKIEDSINLTRQLIGDVKSMSLSLNGDRVTKVGIVKALALDAERLNKSDIITAGFTSPEAFPTLDPNIAVILYRMTQEIINNILKHAEASDIKITIATSENLLTLVITDNGIGFDTNNNAFAGSGLLNLQNRAKLINATLSINSVPGNGTSAHILLPI